MVPSGFAAGPLKQEVAQNIPSAEHHKDDERNQARSAPFEQDRRLREKQAENQTIMKKKTPVAAELTGASENRWNQVHADRRAQKLRTSVEPIVERPAVGAHVSEHSIAYLPVSGRIEKAPLSP